MFHIIEDPSGEFFVLRLIQFKNHQIDNLCEHEAFIEFQFVTSRQAHFAGKSTHCLLEEPIDGADGKSGIIVKDVFENGCSPLPDLGFRDTELSHQVFTVI